jgi:gamma-glutamylcyclotransferase (GGCT)/AIG2-like uncharacterized protein YtfP
MTPFPGQQDRLSTDPAALFVYGTLTFPEVVRVLLGRTPDTVAVSVAGWRVAPLRGCVYPTLVTAEAIAHGRLIVDLNVQEWRIIDAFEDDSYDLRRLTLTDGRYGWAYVSKNNVSVSPEDWDSDQFERRSIRAARPGELPQALRGLAAKLQSQPSNWVRVVAGNAPSLLSTMSLFQKFMGIAPKALFREFESGTPAQDVFRQTMTCRI